MPEVFEFILIAAVVLALLYGLYKIWRNLAFEEKKHDIRETDEKFREVAGIKREHPRYEEKKREVERFQKPK